MKIKNITLILPAILSCISGLSQQINPTINRHGDNKDDKVFILGNGTTDALDFDKLNASGGVSLYVKTHKHADLYLTYNFGGKVISTEKSDSIQLNSLYFPDIGTSAFAGTLDYEIPFRKLKKIKEDEPYMQILLSCEGSVQQRNIQNDSSIYHLSIANINYGVKYKWSYVSSDKKNNLVFTLGAMWNQIFINKNNADNFNALFNGQYNKNDYQIDRLINGLSFLASVQLNNSIIYFRTYQKNNTAADLSFTVGIKVTGKFISF